MFLSYSCAQAVQAVLFLAAGNDGSFHLLADIADRLRLPYHSLSKVLQRLTRAGVLESQKGKRGGFRLRAGSRARCLLDVMRVMDGHHVLQPCVLGFAGCGPALPCVMHGAWSVARDSVVREFQRRDLQTLGQTMADRLGWWKNLAGSEHPPRTGPG